MNLQRLTRGSTTREIWVFLILAYGLSWILVIPGLKIVWVRILVLFGSYGPAAAAMLLSYRGDRLPDVPRRSRLAWLMLFLVVGVTAWYFTAALSIPRTIPGPDKLVLILGFSLYVLAPAWVLSGAFSRDKGVRELLRTLVCPRLWTWQVVSVASWTVYMLSPLVVMKLRGGQVPAPNYTGPPYTFLPFAAAAFGVELFGAGVGEEPGWRGYLLPRLQRTMSPLRASFGVWIAWTLWHLPTDVIQYASGRTFQAYLENRWVPLLPVTVIITWLYNRSRGSILTASLLHSSMNFFAELYPSLHRVIWLLFVWAAAVAIWDRMWRFQELVPVAPLADAIEAEPDDPDIVHDLETN